MRRIGRAMHARGVSCVVVCSDSDGFGRRLSSRSLAEAKEHFSEMFVARKLTDIYTFAPGIAILATREIPRADIVHVHALFSFSSSIAGWMSMLLRKRLVLRPLGALAAYGLEERRPLLKRISLFFIERPLLRFAAAVHCTSAKEELEVLRVEPQARTVVVPLGIEATERIAFTKAASMLRLPTSRRYVLCMARVDPVKNIPLLLRAFESASSMVPDIDLLIAGSGTPIYEEELRCLSRTLDCSSRVHWLGHLQDGEKAAALSLASVFALTSHTENFGVAVAEALSLAVPCVVTVGVGISRDVETAGAGFVVEANIQAVASALVALFTDFELHARCAQNARGLADARYSEAAFGQKLVELYRSLPSLRRKSRAGDSV
jgi:glycosyltransferase involved in cell wall biosynthesis